MQVTFRIDGTHEGSQKNAIPKIKKTARQSWTPQVKRYTKWRDYVQRCFIHALLENDAKVAGLAQLAVLKGDRPVPDTGEKIYLSMKFFFRGERHGDPENIFGSIADALLQQDKHVTGRFDYDHVIEDPHVDVTIKW